MMPHEKMLSLRQTAPTTLADAQTEQTLAPESVVNKIVGSLGLARKRDEQAMNKANMASALTDPAWKVRVEAVQKLGMLGRQAPLELLLVALHDEQSSVRAAAARALGNGPRPAAVSALIAALDDAGWLVRTEVARALGSLHASVAREPLLAALRDSNAEVRTAAIWALGQIGTATVIEPLHAALEDEDWLVRETAMLVLDQLARQTAFPPFLSVDQATASAEATEAGLKESADLDYPPRHKGQPDNRGRSQHAIRVGEGLLASLVILCLIFSWFVIASWRHPASVEQSNTAAMTTYRAHSSSVEKLVWSPDGLFIASADLRGMIMIWQASTGETLATYTQSGQVLALIWNSTTSVEVVYGEQNHAIQVLEIRLDRYYEVQTLFQQGHLPGIPDIAVWSPDGQTLAFDAGNGSIQIWNVLTHTHLSTIQENPDLPADLAWSAESNQLATVSSLGLLQIWNASTGQNLATLASEEQVTAVIWENASRNASIDPLLFLTQQGNIMEWRPANGSQAFSLLLSPAMYNVENSPHLRVSAFSLSQNGRQLALSTSDGIIQTRDAVSGNPVDVFIGPDALVNDVEWSPDGRYIASASVNTTVEVWQEP